jgi:hypothetical protein
MSGQWYWVNVKMSGILVQRMLTQHSNWSKAKLETHKTLTLNRISGHLHLSSAHIYRWTGCKKMGLTMVMYRKGSWINKWDCDCRHCLLSWKFLWIPDYHIQVLFFNTEFGSTKPPAHPDGRGRVSSWNVRSHLDAAVWLRIFHWVKNLMASSTS